MPLRSTLARSSRAGRSLRTMDPEPGEQVFFHGHPSWRAMLTFYGRGVLISILAGAVAGVVTAIASSHVERG
jgi:hypothetical protein